jgi:diaminopimelate decarboxylase
MDHFHYKQGVLHAEEVSLEHIAQQVGTPFYVYSTATLQRHFTVFHSSLAALKPLICFAVKSNSNPHVLRVLEACGAGADVVSAGEIRLARAAGIPASKIIFSGVGKQRREIAYALEEGVFQFNVESLPELHVISEEAARLGKVAPIALRVNPDVDAGTHEKITTGTKTSKFGIDIDEAEAIYAIAAQLPNIKIQGVSVHIGSQLTSLAPFRAAYQRVRQFVEAMRKAGYTLDVVDLGGGLGIPYERSQTEPPLPEAYGAMVAEVMHGFDAQFAFEPGRLIAGNAGLLVASTLYVKHTQMQDFLIVDAAMNDLVRPAMYGAHHDVMALQEKPHDTAYHIVGPVCESSDIFGKGLKLPAMQEGDRLAFRSAGAYGAVMSNQYNARALVPEVLVEGATFKVIRTRPTMDEMMQCYSL